MSPAFTTAVLHRGKYDSITQTTAITLCEVGKRRNSVKRRREHLQEQKDNGFWQGLNDVFQACHFKGLKLYKENKAQLVKLVQKANEKKKASSIELKTLSFRSIWHLIKYEDPCSACKRLTDETEAGDVIVFCKGRSTVEDTTLSLELKLEKTRQELRYW